MTTPLNIEETHIEGQRELASRLIRSAAVAIIHNPYAGSFAEELENSFKQVKS